MQKQIVSGQEKSPAALAWVTVTEPCKVGQHMGIDRTVSPWAPASPCLCSWPVAYGSLQSVVAWLLPPKAHTGSNSDLELHREGHSEKWPFRRTV